MNKKLFSKRQSEIIAAAAEIISKKGIQNLTIKNLSKKIGVTEPAIYRHFKNKEDILFNLLIFFKEKITENFNTTEIKLNESKKVFPLLEKFFDEHISIFLQYPAFSFILFSEEIFQNNKKVFKKIIEIIREEETMILKIIQMAYKSKEIRTDISPENATHILLGSIRLLIKKWYFSNFQSDLNKDYSFLWTDLKNILLKKSQPNN